MEGGAKKDVEKRVRRVKSKRRSPSRRSHSKRSRSRSLRYAVNALRARELKVIIDALKPRRPQTLVYKREKIESPRVRVTGYANNPNEGCTIKMTPYYHASVRSQPPYSAAACCGQTRLGNNGRYWTSVENGNKCKWV